MLIDNYKKAVALGRACAEAAIKQCGGARDADGNSLLPFAPHGTDWQALADALGPATAVCREERDAFRAAYQERMAEEDETPAPNLDHQMCGAGR